MFSHIAVFVLALFLFLNPAAAQNNYSSQCILDKQSADYDTCPYTDNNNALFGGGFNGARLDPEVTQSATPIWVHDMCAYVDADGLDDPLFIPFNSADEWEAFLDNTPQGARTADCCLPRSMVVADVPRPSKMCGNGNKWVLLGLVDKQNTASFIARPFSNDLDSELYESYNCASCKGKQGVRPFTLPIARDDIGAIASNYTALWSCGNATLTTVDFRLQCNSEEWKTVSGQQGKSCEEKNEGVYSKSCPAGQTGAIVIRTRHVCDGSNDGAGQSVETEDRSQCTDSVRQQPVENTCTASENISTRSCPSGSVGTIYVYTSHYCDGSNGGKGRDAVSENNQCSAVQTPSPTGITCVPSEKISTRSCPSGSIGAIYVYTSHYCDGSNGGRGRDAVSENNQCSAVPSSSPAATLCVTSETVTSRSCPSGYTGSVYVYTSHYCDGSNGGRGRDAVSENNQCGPISYTPYYAPTYYTPTYYEPAYEEPVYYEEPADVYYYDEPEEIYYDEPEEEYYYDEDEDEDY